MRRLVCIFIAMMLAAAAAGCTAPAPEDTGDGRISVVATIFPQYDFARQVGGEYVNVKMLLPPGSEAHTFEPSPKDILAIQGCDLFIYTGGESDAWIEDMLSSLGDDAPHTLTLMECVEAVEEELVEGMEGEQDHGEHGADEEAPELDEHVWTSPKNAVLIAERIAKELENIDIAHAKAYAENAEQYTAQLKTLDEEFAEKLGALESRVIIVGDRFPFRYMADAYDIEYYAAFPGCSADSEPSAATVAFLCDKITAGNIDTVFYIEFSNHVVADAIAEATGAKTAMLHSCHNVTADELTAGATYVSIMEHNLEALLEAMS